MRLDRHGQASGYFRVLDCLGIVTDTIHKSCTVWMGLSAGQAKVARGLCINAMVDAPFFVVDFDTSKPRIRLEMVSLNPQLWPQIWWVL